jgi:hypothetical protein
MQYYLLSLVKLILLNMDYRFDSILENWTNSQYTILILPIPFLVYSYWASIFKSTQVVIEGFLCAKVHVQESPAWCLPIEHPQETVSIHMITKMSVSLILFNHHGMGFKLTSY